MFATLAWSAAVMAVLVGCDKSSGTVGASEAPDRLVGAGGLSSADVPFGPTPETDPFYQPPSPLPDAPAGTVLKSRKVTFAPVGGRAMTNDAWQLQFVSHDVTGKPIAAIATVVKPMTPVAGAAPLLAFQYAEDGLGNSCAPSHQVTGSTNNSVSQSEAAEPLPGLQAGWTLVYPDHEGPYSAYATGRLAGQITLDAVRAALQFKDLGLTAKTPVGMWGYSGGAIATGWAATLQKTYAPELNIVGIATGGTPADLIGVAKNGDTNQVTNAAFFNLLFSAIIGINRSYPSLVTPILNDKGRTAARALADGCNGNTTDGSSVTGHFADFTTTAPFDSAGVKALAAEISLPQANQAPVANTFVYHSMVDELIPVAGATAMVGAWCKAGSHVNYYQGATGEHASFSASVAPQVIAYLTARFNGAPADVVPAGSTACN